METLLQRIGENQITRSGADNPTEKYLINTAKYFLYIHCVSHLLDTISFMELDLCNKSYINSYFFVP